MLRTARRKAGWKIAIKPSHCIGEMESAERPVCALATRMSSLSSFASFVRRVARANEASCSGAARVPLTAAAPDTWPALPKLRQMDCSRDEESMRGRVSEGDGRRRKATEGDGRRWKLHLLGEPVVGDAADEV